MGAVVLGSVRLPQPPNHPWFSLTFRDSQSLALRALRCLDRRCTEIAISADSYLQPMTVSTRGVISRYPAPGGIDRTCNMPH
eukprot:6214394-Pleurochrysis_carterae.AAC.1